MQKGQGSLEYLLILGGVIMVAVIVVATIIGITSPAADQTVKDTANLFCGRKAVNQCCAEVVTVKGTNYTCTIDATTHTKCEWDKVGGQGNTRNCFCYNLIKDTTETDVDCGNACTYPTINKKCAAGKTCAVAADCISGVCSGTPLKCT